MTIINGSFEERKTGGGPGEAEGWGVVQSYTAEEFAEFTVSVADLFTRGQETFEGEWPAGFDTGLVGAFDGLYEDLDPAYFDPPGGLPMEDFEELWGTGNQGPLSFESLPAEAAVFGSSEPSGPQAFEDFEHGWPAGQAVIPVFTPALLSAAAFSPGAKTHEDFEAQWRGNESYNWSFPLSGTGGELSFSFFATGYGATSMRETFEGALFDFALQSVQPAADTLTKVVHGLVTPWVVTLRNTGGRLPDGLLTGAEYVVQNETPNTFQLAATNGGAIVDLLDVGYGTHYVKHDTTWYWTEELTGV